jgi:cytochrome c-type biogenesis protein CcmF
VHTGIVFIAVGLAGYGYYQFKEDFSVKPGQEISVKDYTLRYTGLRSSDKRNYKGVKAAVEVYDSGEFRGILNPEKRFYKKAEPTTEVAIMNGLEKDLYLILGGWTDEQSISLTVVINPFLTWVWVGTGVIVFGTVWAALPRRRRESEADIAARDFLLHMKKEAAV